MLKKITPYFFAVFAALSLTLIPAPVAVAWDRVCMQTYGTPAQFHVAHTFRERSGEIPNKVQNKRIRFVKGTHRTHNENARGKISARELALQNKDACVNIRGIPKGESFFVYGMTRHRTRQSAALAGLSAALAGSTRGEPEYFLCPGSEPWLIQNDQPGDTWVKLGGPWKRPRCSHTDRR